MVVCQVGLVGVVAGMLVVGSVVFTCFNIVIVAAVGFRYHSTRLITKIAIFPLPIYIYILILLSILLYDII